jgi:hypothetical protein
MDRSAGKPTAIAREAGVRRGARTGRRWWLAAAPLALLAAGCAALRPGSQVDNPSTVTSQNYEQVWTEIVGVVEKHFDIANESRYDGRIVTRPQAAATLFEPWRPDSIGLRQRLQATLQTIRRQGFILVQPAPEGGFTITVEVYKELEHLPSPVFTNYSGGSLIQSIQPIQESVVTSPIPPSQGWISLGRDALLEARILNEIRTRLDGF